MTTSRTETESPLIALWRSMESTSLGGAASAATAGAGAAAAASSSAVSAVTDTATSSYRSAAHATNWMVENRGGIAKITGFLMVPSQLLGTDKKTSKEIINNLKNETLNGGISLETIEIKSTSTGEILSGVICYPNEWKREDKSRCVLFHNPNGVTVAQYFKGLSFSWTPAQVLSITKCPIILYDYSGTGLNQVEGCTSSSHFRPTYESVVKDGLDLLNYAMQTFAHVDVWGSSLGGGVATVSLERYLTTNPEHYRRVTLINHDSFTTTPRVLFPAGKIFIDYVGWAVGASLDAQTPMEALIQRDVSVIVLCHTKDPVIPEGARMAEYITSRGRMCRKVKILNSDRYGHANLTSDMREKLTEHIFFQNLAQIAHL